MCHKDAKGRCKWSGVQCPFGLHSPATNEVTATESTRLIDVNQFDVRQLIDNSILLVPKKVRMEKPSDNGSAQAKRFRTEPIAPTAHANTKESTAKAMPQAKKRKINVRLEIHLSKFGFHSKQMPHRKCLEDAYAREMAESPDRVHEELTRSFHYIMKIVKNPQEPNPEESAYSSELD